MKEENESLTNSAYDVLLAHGLDTVDALNVLRWLTDAGYLITTVDRVTTLLLEALIVARSGEAPDFSHAESAQADEPLLAEPKAAAFREDG